MHQEIHEQSDCLIQFWNSPFEHTYDVIFLWGCLGPSKSQTCVLWQETGSDIVR